MLGKRCDQLVEKTVYNGENSGGTCVSRERRSLVGFLHDYQIVNDIRNECSHWDAMSGGYIEPPSQRVQFRNERFGLEVP